MLIRVQAAFLLISLVWSSAQAATYVVDVPNPCVTIAKVEPGAVYLESGTEHCVQTPSRKPVEMDARVEEITIYVDGAEWKHQPAVSFDMDSLRDRMEQISDLSRTIEIPRNTAETQAAGRAQELADYYHSPAYQQRIQEERSRVLSELFPGQEKEARYYQDTKKSKPSGFSPGERLYIFISSSVPMQTLRTYAAAIDAMGEAGVVFVVRGFKDTLREIRPTMRFMTDILKKDPSCDLKTGECETFGAEILIDPLLFRRYGVEKVPAFVYASAVSVRDADMSEGLADNASVTGHHVAYGDASLEAIIERFHKETGRESLRGMLARLRQGYYK